MKKIQTKMILLILLPTILFFVGMIVYISITFSNLSTKQAEELLDAKGQTIANEIRIKIRKALASTDTVASSIKGIKENNADLSREEVNIMLQQLLDMSPEFVSAWTFWEPNAFDGKDKDYVNKTGHDQTGRFISLWSQNESGEYAVEPIAGYESGEIKEILQGVLDSGKSVIYEPYEYEVDGEIILMTSIVSPVTVNEKTVGIVGVDVALDVIHQFVNEFTIYDSGFAGVITSTGAIISHENEEILGANYFETSAVAEDSSAEKIQHAVKSGETLLTEGFSNALQTDVYRSFVPITFEGIDNPWSVFLNAPVDEVTKEGKQVQNVIITIGIIITIVLSLMIYYVTRSIVRPIRQVEEQMNYIAHGDLSREALQVKTKDETGRLANELNYMQERLQNMIRNISNASNAMASQSEELNQSANEVSTGTEQMTKTMEELAIGSETQANRSSDIAAMMGSYVTKIEKAHEDGVTIQQASQQVLEKTEQGRTLMDNSTNQMIKIDEIVHDAVSKVEGLDQHSKNISQLVKVIQDIAEQTNLLALNAAIEAARAGEHGKGFAVVADEVRKLAEESSQSVVNITEIVERIQSESSLVVDSLRSGYKEVEEGTEHIKTTGETFHEISKQVVGMVDNIMQISVILEDIVANSQEVNSAIEDIAAVSEEAAAGIEQTTATTEQTNAAMEEVASSSNELANLAEELNEIVQQFKL